MKPLMLLRGSFRSIRGRVRQCALTGNRRGNVLMIFAFALLPLTFATAMGVDYGAAMRRQTKLNGIADAAALAAVTKPMMDNSMMDACKAARAAFTGQASGIGGIVIDVSTSPGLSIVLQDTLPDGSKTPEFPCPVSGTMTVPTEKPTRREATVKYSGESKNDFAGVLGLATLHIKGSSTAKTSLAPFIDIHVALDTSQSMGLAATDDDAKALWNKTIEINGSNNGCTFGCHVFQKADSGKNGAKVPNEQIAANNNIRLRINVLRDATVDMIQTASVNQGTANNYRFGLYRIGGTLTELQKLTPTLDTAKTTASTVTLGPNDSSGKGDTNLPDTMAKMMPYITAHGDGTTQLNARAFLFLVTDGVTDVQGSCAAPGKPNYGHCTKPIDAADCKAYKDAGITVGIVYTTYLPVKAQPTVPSSTALRPEYTDLVQKFSWPGYTSTNADNSLDIAPALQACASTGWYFEASDEPTIHAAMQRLFTQASQTPTITH